MIDKIREKDETNTPEPIGAEHDAVPDDIKGCAGATGGEEGGSSALPPEALEQLHTDLVAALKTVFDPEIPVDIYELGLIYKIDVDDDRNIEVDMTLTAPGCPVAGEMPGWVENAIGSVPGVGQVKVNLVFDPPWDMSRMSDEARLSLNMF
jgi:FeS assembly SUF system protein